MGIGSIYFAGGHLYANKRCSCRTLYLHPLQQPGLVNVVDIPTWSFTDGGAMDAICATGYPFLREPMPRTIKTRRHFMTIAVYDHAPKPPASLDHSTTITAVVELSKRTWLVGGHVPGLERRPLKRTEDRATGLLSILTTWRKSTEQAGRDGFWLARWLRRTGIEAYVIHPSSIPVPRGARVKNGRR